MIKYTFPITANIRKVLPSADEALSEVEKHFHSFTGEKLGLVVTSQVMKFEINTPVPLTNDQINLAKSTLYPLLIQHFPNWDVEIGEPTISGT